MFSKILSQRIRERVKLFLEPILSPLPITYNVGCLIHMDVIILELNYRDALIIILNHSRIYHFKKQVNRKTLLCQQFLNGHLTRLLKNLNIINDGNV